MFFLFSSGVTHGYILLELINVKEKHSAGVHSSPESSVPSPGEPVSLKTVIQCL